MPRPVSGNRILYSIYIFYSVLFLCTYTVFFFSTAGVTVPTTREVRGLK